jgi:hypothetical protein
LLLSVELKIVPTSLSFPPFTIPDPSESSMPTTPTILRDEVQAGATNTVSAAVEENIRQALQGLQFGEITITVRNGTVILIERVARKRQFKSIRRD